MIAVFFGAIDLISKRFGLTYLDTFWGGPFHLCPFSILFIYFESDITIVIWLYFVNSVNSVNSCLFCYNNNRNSFRSSSSYLSKRRSIISKRTRALIVSAIETSNNCPTKSTVMMFWLYWIFYQTLTRMLQTYHRHWGARIESPLSPKTTWTSCYRGWEQASHRICKLERRFWEIW